MDVLNFVEIFLHINGYICIKFRVVCDVRWYHRQTMCATPGKHCCDHLSWSSLQQIWCTASVTADYSRLQVIETCKVLDVPPKKKPQTVRGFWEDYLLTRQLTPFCVSYTGRTVTSISSNRLITLPLYSAQRSICYGRNLLRNMLTERC